MKTTLCAAGTGSPRPPPHAAAAAAKHPTKRRGSRLKSRPATGTSVPLVGQVHHVVALQKGLERGQALGLRRALARFDDDDVRHVGVVAVGGMPLDAAEDLELAFAV